MSRHDATPRRARVLPATQKEYIGWVDSRGNIRPFSEQATPPKYQIQFLDILAVASLMAIVVLLGVGLGLWVMQ